MLPSPPDPEALPLKEHEVKLRVPKLQMPPPSPPRLLTSQNETLPAPEPARLPLTVQAVMCIIPKLMIPPPIPPGVPKIPKFPELPLTVHVLNVSVPTL